jgi:hypothetical protein
MVGGIARLKFFELKKMELMGGDSEIDIINIQHVRSVLVDGIQTIALRVTRRKVGLFPTSLLLKVC